MGCELLSNTEENRRLLTEKDKCDKYDYLIATGCGAIGGIVDSVFVGMPGKSKLGNWSDEQTEKFVKLFAKKHAGWDGKGDLSSAISSLERKYKVNYDQRYGKEIGGAFDSMTPSNHHMKSIAHSPDPLGLVFSIINQFTSTATFIDNGKIITVNTESFELQGYDFKSKLYCGTVNWIGHLISDMAGSSSSARNGNRGKGIVIPFYELFGLCDFGSFGENKKTLAEIATQAYTGGYDFRHGVAMSIPVILTEALIRLVWAIRRHFEKGYPIKECIPTSRHDTLRVMLLVGEGTLCIIDAADAGIRSGGNFLMFFMHLNLIAWNRFVYLVIKEVCIRVGIQDPFNEQLTCLKRMDQAVTAYLVELKKIDKERFREENEKFSKVAYIVESASNEQDFNLQLLNFYDDFGIKIPWTGDFNEFMGNKNNSLKYG